MIPELHQNIVGYVGKYTQIKKVSSHEWAGPCPVCGGKDRFRVNDQRGWFCRKCTGDDKWGDLADFTALVFGWSLKETLQHFNLDRRATPEEVAAMDAQRKQAEAEQRQAELDQQAQVHEQLTQSGDWWTYYDNLSKYPEARAMWNRRGLSDEWIEYYRLGFCPARRFGNGDDYFEAKSLTIPYFRPIDHDGEPVTWNVVQLKHRIIGNDTPGGKYRPHLSGAGNHLFYTDLHQRNIFGDLLIVEGEIKAMVTWSALWVGYDCLMPNTTVIGIPGQGWRTEWVEQFNRARTVTICLDPDARKSAQRLQAMIGEKARVIQLPDKIDDLIVMGVLDGFKLMEIMS